MDSKTFMSKGNELPFQVAFQLLLVYKKAKSACLVSPHTELVKKKIW